MEKQKKITSSIYGLARKTTDIIGHGCTQTCLAIQQRGGYSKPYYFGSLYTTREAAEANKLSGEEVVVLTLEE